MARLPAPGIRTRWILAVIIVGALLAVGFTYNNRLRAEQTELLASIALSNKTIDMFRAIDLTPLEAQVADLETRADNAENRKASLARQYQGYTHSIEIEERLYRAAAEANVTINSIECSGPRDEEGGGIQFKSYLVNVDAEADVPPPLLNFLQKVSGYFDSGVIGSINLAVPRPPDEGTTEEKTSLTFQIRVVFISQEAA